MTEFELEGPLETERLILRQWTPEDFDALFAMHSRPEVARYLYWDARNGEEVRPQLEKKIKAVTIREDGDHIALAAQLKATGEVIGDFVLILVSQQHNQGEIGFIIDPAHQGQGYGVEGGRAVLQVAFEDLKLHRVIGRADARNTASARLMEKLGMRREAHLIENEFVKDEWVSEVDYAILAAEWGQT